jgi:hypothetical protein
MKPLLASLLLFAPLISLASVADREYTLSLNILKSGDSCAMKASAMAEGLRALQNVKVVETVCEEGVEHWDRVTLRYQARHSVFVYATSLGTQSMGPETGRTLGVYRKMQECAEDLAARSAEYVAQTGVALFAATCEVAALDFGYPFLATFYSLERPKVSLWQHEWEAGAPREFKELLRDRLTKGRGYVVKEVDDRRVFFYSKSRPDFKVSSFARYSEMSECEAERSYAEAILLRSGQSWGLTLCQRESYGVALPGYFKLISFGEGASLMPGFPTLSEEYLTYAGCAKDRPRQLADFERRTGQKPLGGICSPESSGRAKLSIYTGSAS